MAQHHAGARFTVFDTVLLGRKPYIKFEPAPEDFRIVETIIKQLNLEDLRCATLTSFPAANCKSNAGAGLAQQPQVLLLDEPTSNLDLSNQYEVLAIVREIARKNT